MKKTLINLSCSIAILSSMFALTACSVDEAYNFENISAVDKTMTLFENGLSIPVLKSSAKFNVDSILKRAGLDTSSFGQYLKSDGNGGYLLSIEGNYSLDSEIEKLNLSDIVQLDPVSFSEEFSYEMGDMDASSMKIDAQEFGSQITLDDFSSALDITIPPISQKVSKPFGLASVDYSFDYSVNPVSRTHTVFSQKSIQDAAKVAAAMSQTSFQLQDVNVSLNVEPQTVPAATKPSSVRSVSDVKLKSGARMTVSLSVINSVFTQGSIKPQINIDLSDLVVFEGGNGVVDLSSMILNKSGNYSATKSFNISGLNVSKLFSEKSISITGNLSVSDAEASTSLAQSIPGDLGVRVNISFEDFGIDSFVAEIAPVSTTVSQNIPISIPSITLPEQVKSVSEISFTDASQINLNIKATNLSSITGLNAKISKFVIKIPSALRVSGTGVSDNTLTITDANLASEINRTVKLLGINLPAPSSNVINWSGNFEVEATVVVDGTVNTALLPKTESSDVVFEASTLATLTPDDFNAVINPISQNIQVAEKQISMSLPEGIGNFGTFTIVPQGSPSLSVSMSIPDLGSLALASANGIKIKLPDIVKFSSVPAELNYDSASNTITIRDIKTANYSLPIEKIVVTPVKGSDGKYSVSTSYSVDGTVGIAESTVTKSTVDKLSGATVAFSASIPELKAKSISVDEISYSLDNEFNFVVLEAASIPDILVKVHQINISDVTANLDIKLEGLPDIGSGKFTVDMTAKLPDFINPSIIELKGDIAKDGSFSKSIAINGFDFSSVDFPKLKAENKPLSAAVTLNGKIAADHPSVDLNSLSGTIKAKVNARIADSQNKISLKNLKAVVDYQLDTTFVFDLGLGDALAGAKLDLPDFTLNADISSNLAIPINANAVIGEGGSDLKMNFPYSNDPSVIEKASNKFVVDLDPILSGNPESIGIKLNLKTDTQRTCYISTDAEYTLGIDYSLSCPVQLGDHFEYVYADTLDFGADTGATLQEILSYTNAGIKATVDNSLPFSLSLEAELLAYDASTGEYRKVDIEPIRSDILTAKTKSDIELNLKARKDADLSGISHLKFSAKVTSNGETLNKNDYLMLQNVSVIIPDGLTFNPDNIK
ncbi:MAG: hypothetical protein PUB45_02310 [Bacteroidales bacterium]|nr:hypothetical protein [Bacteroidales bacterium]